MSTARRVVTFEGPFRMHRGGVIESPTLAYETWGELNAAKDNAVLIFTGLSPSAHATSCAEDRAVGEERRPCEPELVVMTDRPKLLALEISGNCPAEQVPGGTGLIIDERAIFGPGLERELGSVFENSTVGYGTPDSPAVGD